MNKPLPKFQIQQIAIFPADPVRAVELLTDLGLTDWVEDLVKAKGKVFGRPVDSDGHLRFNYQAGGADPEASKPLELEVLDYPGGAILEGDDENINWMDYQGLRNSVSHFGMHVTAEELDQFHVYFASKDIKVAQAVDTYSHTNEYIANSRRYTYVIFDTRDILGVDLKFIVRRPLEAQAVEQVFSPD